MVWLISLPADTKPEEAADRLTATGKRWAEEGLLFIQRGNLLDYADLTEKRSKLPAAVKHPDGRWGPFVYLYHDREWVRR
jgi:hypothetical protein